MRIGENEFLAAERRVKLQSAALKKELRPLDLVGILVVGTVGVSWIGTAGKLGSGHVWFWLPAILLFFIPSGIVVAHLSEEMPLEGGIYQWGKLCFGPMIGFLAALNLWMMNILYVSGAGLQIMGTSAYWLPPGAAWLATNKPVTLAVSVAIVCGLMLVAWRGLAIGKWISTIGGFAIVAIYCAVVFVAVPRWFHGTSAVAPVAFSLPALTLFNVNILAKMAVGALSGIDSAAVFAAEYRSTERDTEQDEQGEQDKQNKDIGGAIRKAVWLAAPLIACMMVLGTAAVLTFSRPASIDLLMPPIQVFSLGAPALAPVASALIVFMTLAGASLSFSLMIRFPMVAGWDHLLPAWFSRLDPRYRTPAGSVLFAGASVMAFTILANVGAGAQEAYQFALSATVVFYACAYLVMFAIPLAPRAAKPPWSVRLAALSGFVMTLLFIALSVFPIVEEQHPGLFMAKMLAVVIGLQTAGILYYRSKVTRL